MPDASSETLQLLLEAGQLLSSKRELGELLPAVLELSSRLVDAESASLLLLDEKTQTLYFDVALGLGEEASRLRLPLGKGIAGSVAQDRRPALINDVRRDPRWSPEMDKQSGFITRSVLAVPMTFKGKLVGVLEAINKRSGSFAEKDLQTFTAFASQVSVSIENARLFSSLREERFRLQTVFAQMADGAILTDKTGRVLLANETAHKYLADGDVFWIAGALKDLKITPPLEELFKSEASCQAFEAVREGPKKLVLAGKATRIDLGQGKRGSDGKAAPEPGWLCVFHDVTEERLKEKLKRTSLSLISHKLKTPLASIIGYSDLLREDFTGKAGSDPQLKAAQSIYVQGRKLADLVNKLLNYTTLEDTSTPLAMAPCSVDEIMAETLKSMEEWLTERNATVLYDPSSIVVVGEKYQLEGVLKNLIENAVKFDPKPERRVAVSARSGDGRALISVKDSGPGIPPEDQEKIYSQFHQVESSFTGQVEGWGLGLPFVKKVVEHHGGNVELQSVLSQGTTVTVNLPLASKEEALK